MSLEGMEKFANILGADTVKKIYEDGLSSSVQETGKISTDLIKAARLFTAPIQFLSAYQDKLDRHLKRIRDGVPEDKQIPVPAYLSMPVFDKLKYLEEQDYLTDFYVSLLQKALDRERVNEAHPAFFSIIEQLSPDEALILLKLRNTFIEYDYTGNFIIYPNGNFSMKNVEPVKNTTPPEDLLVADYFEMYIEHLGSLNLIESKTISQDTIVQDDGKRKGLSKTKITLSKFGELFVKACIPKDKVTILKAPTS